MKKALADFFWGFVDGLKAGNTTDRPVEHSALTSLRQNETSLWWLLGVPALAFSESSVVRASRAVPRDSAELWLNYAIVLMAVFLLAGAITGMAAVARSQRAAWKRNFIISAYAAMGLVLLGQYGPK